VALAFAGAEAVDSHGFVDTDVRATDVSVDRKARLRQDVAHRAWFASRVSATRGWGWSVVVPPLP
jgi:hypothetical protein